MKVRLESKDVAEIAKSLKSGWLDMGKVAVFQRLIKGYNPPKAITKQELDYYLDCLKKGWGYIPTDQENLQQTMLENLPDDLKAEWIEQINEGSIYRNLIKEAFLGLCALKGLGGTFTDQEGDFSFMEQEPEY